MIQNLRDAYVRTEYYFHPRPVEWGLLSGSLIALLLWLVTGGVAFPILYACGLTIGLIYARRSPRGKARWTRWTERHPYPPRRPRPPSAPA